MYSIPNTNNILIVSGEPSGDSRGSEILKTLKNELPDTHFWGIGGDLLAKEGLELIEHIRDFSLVGAIEIIKHLPKIFTQFKKLTTEIIKRKPNAVILIDYPGFNLKLAKWLHGKNIPVIY